MISFPNCKINIGLQVLGKREDGFHEIETVFYPVALYDALEIISSATLEFTATGLPVDGSMADNLCVKAYHLLKKDFPQLPYVKIHLHKSIPMGAGLGGGSADSAFMLNLLNNKFNLNLTTPQLINYALQLGSDCPFFIINKPCIAKGRGERLEEIEVDISKYKIVLVNPGIHVNTGWAFSQLLKQSYNEKTFIRTGKSIKQIIAQPIISWKDELLNDFELPVFNAHPQIKEIKETLYKMGALYAAMSGSGSTVFGVFNTNIDTKMFEGKNYFIKTIN
ncbi:MAG: 4-(cytidine 5'-diphospho)-2-C-methyl-D-erythritol kinase [Ferruginibacter sp.]|nr:4-(cytidine 5'-diphospho)-2-C-methyl-D-erythritol kinase [Ferruginibacter sp.]